MNKRTIYIITAILLVMSLAPATAFAGTAEGNSNLTIDTLTATIGGEPQTLDPAFADRVDSANYILHMLEGLTTIDRSGKVVPGIAESWDITSGGTVYTFHLRNAEWSDGQAVTADDFVYAWQRIIDPQTNSSTAYNMMFVKNAAKIANGELPVSELGVESLDEGATLQVTLEAPCGFFLQVVGNTTYMPARSDMVDAHPDDWTQSAGTYPSDGPYMLQSWDHDSQIIMVKNPDYWNISNITGPNKIVWKLMGVSDPDAVRAAYEANELQYAGGVPAELYDSKDLREFPSLGTYYLNFNNTKAPFDDVRVRQAINLVIDRNRIVDMLGNNEPADNFVPKGITQPDDTDFNEEATPAYSTDPSEYDANVTRAKALLADAGFPNGENFPTIDYITNDGPGHADIAGYIQEDLLNQLGINMEIRSLDWDSFTAERSAGNFGIARDGWLADYGDPYSFLQLFKSDSEGNRARYSNTAYDNLLEQSNTETNMTARFQLLQDAQYQLMHEDNAVCPIFYYTQHAAAKPKLNSITYVNSGFTFFFWTVQGRIDTLTATIGPEPNSLDPVFVNDVPGANYILHMLEGLTTIDQSGKVVPGIAASWDINEDGTVYKFHLRDEAKWSDGQAVTADDFVYAWQRVANPENHSAYSYFMEFLKNGKAIIKGELPISDLGVVAIDNKTLQVTLESPYCSFLELTGSAALVPTRSDIIDADPNNWANSADTYLADGPYKMQSWDHGSQIVMVRNPNYWNNAYITGPGTIVWKLMDDANAVHTAYVENELQYAKGVSAALYDSVDLKEYPTLGTNYLNFNCTKAPFDDVRVRKAINLVIDRNYIKGLIGGNEPADNFVPKGFSQPDGTDFNEEAASPYSISPYDYDSNVEQAKKLLADAGYSDTKPFPQIAYGTNNESTAQIAIAEYIKQVLSEKLDIDVAIQSMDWGSFQTARAEGDFDIARMGWIIDYYDLYNFLQVFKSDNSINNAYYSNPAYDSFLEQANAATDMTSRFQYMQQAQNLLMNQDYAICPIFHYTKWAAAKPNLSGIVNANVGYTFFFWTVQIPESESLTQEGSNVEINNDLASTTITFENVTDSGFTYPQVIENPPVGTSFHLKDSVGYLDINSTADFTGGVTITVSYDPSEISGSESALKIYQFKDGRSIDITQFVDTENNTITGVLTDHFCAFAVGIPSTYLVTYNTQDGSDATSGSVGNGALIDDPQNPYRRGYAFDGWYKEPECKNVWDFTSDRMPERDITLYAKWTPITYTVKYDKNGGTGVMDDSVFTYGESADLRTNGYSREGYTFSGWSLDSDGTVSYTDKANVSNLADTQDKEVTLYAKWTPISYTVTFSPGTGATVDPVSKQANYDATYGDLPVPVKRGYSFNGWYTGTGGTGKLITSSDIVDLNSNTTLYAKWAPITYTVKYDKNDGTGVMDDSVFTYDEFADLRTNGYSKAGYAFSGWALAEYGGVAYTDGANVRNLTHTQDAKVTLYAKWTPITYTVKYDKNGGTGTMADSLFTYDESAGLRTNEYLLKGYEFFGWSLGRGEETVYVDGESVSNLAHTQGAQVTLYAEWRPITYTVIYDKNGGTGTMADSLFTYDVSADLRTNEYSRTGYTFIGWALSAGGTAEYYDGGSASNLADTQGAVVTLFAKWTANPYTVTFSVDSGAAVDPSSKPVTFDEPYGQLPVPTKTGYYFFGWYNAVNGSGDLIERTDIVNTAGNITLYARWVSNSLVALKAPSLIVKPADYKSVTLTWTAVTGAEGYEVWKKIDGVYKYYGEPEEGDLSFTDKDLSTGVTYYYQVRAYLTPYHEKVFSSLSSYKSAKPAWPAVTLTVVSNSYDSIKLTWNSVAGATAYDVQRLNPISGKYETIPGAGAWTDVNYTDTGREKGKTYSYKVRAYVSDTEFTLSASKSAKPAWQAVKLTAVSNTYSSVKLTWNPIPDAAAYDVQRLNPTSGKYETIPGAGAWPTTDYTDTGREKGKTYYYKVRAYVSDTEFTLSGSKSAKPAWPAVTLTAAPNSYNSIKLTWNPIPYATYDVQRLNPTSGKYETIPGAGAWLTTTYTDTGRVKGTTYSYKIRAYVSDTEFTLSGSKSTKPAWPAVTLTAASDSYNSIKLTWNPIPDATYDVQRLNPASGKYETIPGAGAWLTTTYTDTGREKGKTYYYKVRAYVSDTEFTLSSSKSAKAVPSAPEGIALKKTSAISIKISWDEVTGAAGYEVYRATSLNGTYTLIKAVNVSNYEDTGLYISKTYYYEVRAYTMVGSVKVYGPYSVKMYM